MDNVINSNAPTMEQVLAQALSLSALDKVRLAERLFVIIEREIETLSSPDADAARRRAWKATVARTTGALADDPIERPPQGDYEQRDVVL